MGKEVEKSALEKGHKVVLKIDEHNLADFNASNFSSNRVDAAIEFSTPHAAPGNILKCFDIGVPIVSGSTGWMDKFEEISRICIEKGQTLFYASNFSIGVNLFFRLNEYLAEMMNNYTDYVPSLEEIHHIRKKDAPSGTAITLANGLLKMQKRYSGWTLPPKPQAGDGKIVITSKREGEVPGTHIVKYSSAIDEIAITHTAHSRKGFADGAVTAAAWVLGKKGVFGMGDMLNNESR